MKKCQRQTSSWGRLTGQRGWDVNTDYCFHVCLSFPLNCARLQTAFFSSFYLIYCVLFLYSRDISLLYCCAIPSLFPFVKFPLITLSILFPSLLYHSCLYGLSTIFIYFPVSLFPITASNLLGSSFGFQQRHDLLISVGPLVLTR